MACLKDWVGKRYCVLGLIKQVGLQQSQLNAIKKLRPLLRAKGFRIDINGLLHLIARLHRQDLKVSAADAECSSYSKALMKAELRFLEHFNIIERNGKQIRLALSLRGSLSG